MEIVVLFEESYVLCSWFLTSVARILSKTTQSWLDLQMSAVLRKQNVKRRVVRATDISELCSWIDTNLRHSVHFSVETYDAKPTFFESC